MITFAHYIATFACIYQSMRVPTLMGLCSLALTIATLPAQADVQSYCEAYARGQADVHLPGSAILGSQPNPMATELKERETLALADCLALYTPRSRIEPATAEPEADAASPTTAPQLEQETVAPAKQETPVVLKPKRENATKPTPRKKPVDIATLVVGSAAWKAYCAAKYASYNPRTDTYTGRSGAQRACRVGKRQAPRVEKRQAPRVTKRQVTPAKSQLPVRAVKSLPPAPPNDKPQWEAFDNPKLRLK